jgi:sugar/nucleoside kinase (ribokinase family)
MREAKAQGGLSVSFDPNSDPAQEWSADIWDSIAAADVVFLNPLEARVLTGARDVPSAIAALAGRAACVW